MLFKGFAVERSRHPVRTRLRLHCVSTRKSWDKQDFCIVLTGCMEALREIGLLPIFLFTQAFLCTAKKKTFVNNMITLGMVAAAWLIMEILMNTGHVSSLLKGLLVPFCIYVIMAVSLNLTVGILGELSLGHAGFMCVGAFAGALFSKCMKGTLNPTVSLVIAIFIGAAVAAVCGILIGIPVLRLRGDYLAIVTLAFGEIIKNLINAIFLGRDADGFHISFKDSMSLGLKDGGEVLIKGPQGITGTPQAATFTIGIILVLITLVIVMNLVNSRTGRAIMSIRDNRIAAESIGINITKYKLLAFSISAALAGVAGVLYAHNLTTLTALPKNFGYNMSIMILVYVVLGGIGSIRGSVISTVILYLLPELLRGLNNYRMLIYAIVLILAMLFNSAPQFITLRKRIFGGFASHTTHSGKGEA